ncbi:ATP-binding cassette domain-containing protein [Leifsonia sp. L25]|uniref:ATP-binding cassette domain-containing protein n=1 Tax=Leifsonia sp. L25 TaxID=3423957 RepID=UPI003D69027C
MGAGRTELAMSVFGHSYGTWVSGEIYKDGKEIQVRNVSEAIDNGMAYVSEDRKVLGLNLLDDIKQSVVAAKLKKIAELAASSTTCRSTRSPTSTASCCASARRMLDRGVSTLSGGNQQKVVLAKWMFTDPDILILDEPTRGIDVGAKFEIYRIIQQLAAPGQGRSSSSPPSCPNCSESPTASTRSSRVRSPTSSHRGGDRRDAPEKHDFRQEEVTR